MIETVLLPAIYEGSRDLKDKTKKLTFQTNEITPQQAGNLQMMVQQFCYLAIKMEPFTSEEIKIMDDVKSDFNDTGKSHAKRLRSIFYILWQQNNEGYTDYNLYYAFKMEKLIKHYKDMIL